MALVRHSFSLLELHTNFFGEEVAAFSAFPLITFVTEGHCAMFRHRQVPCTVHHAIMPSCHHEVASIPSTGRNIDSCPNFFCPFRMRGFEVLDDSSPVRVHWKITKKIKMENGALDGEKKNCKIMLFGGGLPSQSPMRPLEDPLARTIPSPRPSNQPPSRRTPVRSLPHV